jgi:hypothetical protein
LSAVITPTEPFLALKSTIEVKPTTARSSLTVTSPSKRTSPMNVAVFVTNKSNVLVTPDTFTSVDVIRPLLLMLVLSRVVIVARPISASALLRKDIVAVSLTVMRSFRISSDVRLVMIPLTALSLLVAVRSITFSLFVVTVSTTCRFCSKDTSFWKVTSSSNTTRLRNVARPITSSNSILIDVPITPDTSS